MIARTYSILQIGCKNHVVALTSSLIENEKEMTVHMLKSTAYKIGLPQRTAR